jgi:hypothetical protein
MRLSHELFLLAHTRRNPQTRVRSPSRLLPCPDATEFKGWHDPAMAVGRAERFEERKPRVIAIFGDNVLIDESGQEFVWRQPQGPAQLRGLLQAARVDPFCGYAWDGDEHWTTELVREWWATRGEVSEWIDRQLGNEELLSSAYNYERAAVGSLQKFRAYFNVDLQSDLREYVFWLEKHRTRADDEPLPMLNP